MLFVYSVLYYIVYMLYACDHSLVFFTSILSDFRNKCVCRQKISNLSSFSFWLFSEVVVEMKQVCMMCKTDYSICMLLFFCQRKDSNEK